MRERQQSVRRFLVWSLCFGDECQALGRLWLKSLIDIGRWRHDVIVLGDRHASALSGLHFKAIDVTRDMEARYRVHEKGWNSFVYHNCKPQIQFYTDMRQYDYALYMDIDVLVNTDRLETLLDAKAQKGLICVQKDVIPISANRHFTGRDILSASEKQRWSDVAICAGIVGMPTNDLGLTFIKEWHEANRAEMFRGSDQANLIALLLRRYPRHWEYMGDTAIARKHTLYEETLLHFSNHMHETMRDYFDAVFRFPESGNLRWTLRRWSRRWFVRPVNRRMVSLVNAFSKCKGAQAATRYVSRCSLARRVARYLLNGECR